MSILTCSPLGMVSSGPSLCHSDVATISAASAQGATAAAGPRPGGRATRTRRAQRNARRGSDLERWAAGIVRPRRLRYARRQSILSGATAASIQFKSNPIRFYSIRFDSIQFNSIQFNSIWQDRQAASLVSEVRYLTWGCLAGACARLKRRNNALLGWRLGRLIQGLSGGGENDLNKEENDASAPGGSGANGGAGEGRTCRALGLFVIGRSDRFCFDIRLRYRAAYA